jgi:dolichyl-phosphate-mannose-protein mannosyltransferase
MCHRDTKVFLHSRVESYPLRYDDGRVSSQGPQVTGYPHNDIGNHWQIIPTKAIPTTGRSRVRHNDVVQLLHMWTDTYLMTHDVASPLMPTNQEFTTVPSNDESRHNDTLFQIQTNDAHEGEPWKSKSGHFMLGVGLFLFPIVSLFNNYT